MNNALSEAVMQLAQLTHTFSDADLEQPWAWRFHDEGVRFAYLGTYQELRALALELSDRRRREGPPVSLAHHALAQVHAAYRDLQAIFIGVTDEMYDREPAPGEWPLRYVLGHLVATERAFFTLVHYGLARQRDGGERSSRLPEGEVERVTGPSAEFRELMDNGSLEEMQAFQTALHRRLLDEFDGMSDRELAGPSLWWEGEELPLTHRLLRFDAHSRQHAIQAEKTLAAIGHPPGETRRLLRLLYNALAEVEGTTIGAPNLGAEEQQALADTIAARVRQITTVVEQARQMITAVQAGDLKGVASLLEANPKLVNAADQKGLPAVLAAAYHRRQEVIAALLEAAAELNIFSAAAVGRQEVVEQHLEEWSGWSREVNRDGFTALQLACFFGHEPIALRLIEEGADVNATSQNGQRIRPIHAAAAGGSLAVLEALLAKGADVNARQEGEYTPLHEAASSGNAAMVELFLAHGADKAARSSAGQTPADLARQQGYSQVLALLA